MKKNTLKDDIKSLMQKPKFWLKDILGWIFNLLIILFVILYLHTNNVNVVSSVIIATLVFSILLYIHGTFNYNFPNPLCTEKVTGHVVDYITDLVSGPGEGVEGYLYSYIITIEYKYKNKTYKKLIKSFDETLKIDEIKVCKLFPRLIHIKFSKD